MTHTHTRGPGFADALLFWFKLGFISFGGPAGQIAIMHQELVIKRRWISERRFLHALNYCMVLPGPEAQQLATYLGWLMHRTAGGLAAGILFVLPSLLLVMGLSWLYLVHGQSAWLAGLFYGIKPAVTAIVFQAAHRMGSRTLKNPALWCIAMLSLLGSLWLSVPFPLIVGMAAFVGYAGGQVKPHLFQIGAHGNTTSSPHEPALIDDDTPTPAHARFRWSRLAIIAVSGVLLWILPLIFLLALYGWNSTLVQMGWFFTKAALLTFGGAYAVLSYVFDGAVEHYQWLNATQMLDGLALGETTPGPLIMIVAFVGFLGGWLTDAMGHGQMLYSAMAGACVATWFTFLPSFVFIFAGAPFIETTHNQLRFTAPLTAITAAVVGVIAQLALFFAVHVLWPAGFTSTQTGSLPAFDALVAQMDWKAALIAIGSALALLRFKRTVIEVIAAAGLVGLLLAHV